MNINCTTDPCRVQRKAPVRKNLPIQRTRAESRIEKDISNFPPAIQAQIRAQL